MSLAPRQQHGRDDRAIDGFVGFACLHFGAQANQAKPEQLRERKQLEPRIARESQGAGMKSSSVSREAANTLLVT